MNKKLFLFSNLISISKINCIYSSKIEVYLNNKNVKIEDYIKMSESDDDESDDDELYGVISDKNVSISKIEVELQNDDILNFIKISQIKDYLTNKEEFKKIKIYLVDHKYVVKDFLS